MHPPCTDAATAVARRLREQRDAIVAAWHARAPGAPVLAHAAPHLVDALARALDACGDDRVRAESLGRDIVDAALVAVIAADRARDGFSLGTALRETGALRLCVTDACADLALVASEAPRVLVDVALDAFLAHLAGDNAPVPDAQTHHALFMQAPVAICIHEGPAHTYTFANAPYRAIVGGRDVVGKAYLEALPEIAGQGYDTLLDRVVATGEPYFGAAQPATLVTNGVEEVRWFSFVFAPKRNASGVADGVFECAFEVTEQVLARHRVEAIADRLRASEERLRLVLDASAVGTWSLELASEQVLSDARFRALFELAPDEPFTLAKGLAVIHPDDRAQVTKAIGDAVAGIDGGHYLAEYRTTRFDDGTYRWVEARGQMVRGPDGRPVRLLGTGMDVTLRKRAEAEQRRAREHLEALAARVKSSESTLRLVIDSLPMLVALVNADERYGLVNRAYEEWYGVAAENVIGHTVREIAGAKSYELLGSYVARAMAGESFSLQQDGVPHRDGGSRDIKVTFVSHRDAHGAPDGYVGLAQDVTAERALQAERDRLAEQRREVLESMADAFFALDRDWRVTLVNRNQEIVSQIPREKSLGRSFWELFPATAAPDSGYWVNYHRAMEERVPVKFTEYYAPLDLWTDVNVYPASDGGIAVFFRDVTEEKRTEVTLTRQSEFEKQLIGIVSHDLRNPLNAIHMGATLLVHREDLDARALKVLVRIQAATTRATRMVGDLLDFTQARLGGGIRIERRPADLHEITRGVVDEVEVAHPTREVTLSTRGDGRGEWDADRLGQVVQNLVTNALKYSPEEAPVHVTTGSEAEGDGVILTVHNGGAPIEPERLAEIFQPMQRGTGEVDKATRSVGLGLYIVKSIVDAHRGRIDVVSTREQGTTFTVRLPRTAG